MPEQLEQGREEIERLKEELDASKNHIDQVRILQDGYKGIGMSFVAQ